MFRLNYTHIDVEIGDNITNYGKNNKIKSFGCRFHDKFAEI